MNWFWQQKDLTINQVIDRIEALTASASGVSVTPGTCMRSPTVHAIVTAISRRISVSPVGVFKKTSSNGRDAKEPLPKHPVTQLLNKPNDWQTKIDYWGDSSSELVRYGNCYSFKGRGVTGPVRRLVPMPAAGVKARFDENNRVTYTAKLAGSDKPAETYKLGQLLHARGPARDFLNGDSPIIDVKEAIGMEIAAEQYGATFYANGAIPLMVFSIMQGFKEFTTEEDKTAFLQSVKDKLGGGNRHTALLLPKGIELGDFANTAVNNNQAQFIDSRKYQRTVIAGAFGVPPHLVGDLERATFNNVEQQDSDFTINVVLPYVRILEAALERDLLTPADRAQGVIIRFNLDAIQRADFKSRQEGLQIQRLNGVISADEWREHENMNPLGEDDGGSDYWMPANYKLPSDEPEEGKEDDTPPDGTAGNKEPQQ